MNYEAERAMNQKRLRMEGEPGHGVVQGNGIPLNYIDNGHQIPYQPYAGAYNTHYPPPDAFAAYGPPPPGGYAPQNLSYAPPAHQNYAHHQSFAPTQQPQAQLHMPQSHMAALFSVQGYGDVGMHKGWPPQPHLLPTLDGQKSLDVKQLKPEIKLEPTESQKRQHPENEMMGGDLDQPKIKIKTDIFKPDDLARRNDIDKQHDACQKPSDVAAKPAEQKDDSQPSINDPSRDKSAENKDKPVDSAAEAKRPDPTTPTKSSEDERKPFSSPDLPRATPKPAPAAGEVGDPKKRGRPKGSTNKPKPPGAPSPRAPAPPAARPRAPAPPPRPRVTGYQYAVRPFRKDFSGIQFRRRWSDDCLDSSHIPNEVYFGDVPVSSEVLHNYYDANAERERLASAAAHLAAQKAAQAKLSAARLQARGPAEVTTVDSSSSDDSSGSDDDSDESDENTPLRKGPGRPKGSKNTSPRTPGAGGAGGAGGGRRGRPPVPPELREPGVVEVKKMCKAAGLRFDYKKLVEGCTKNKERVQKMVDLLIAAGLEGKPTLEKCQALKKAKAEKKEQEKLAKKEAKVKHKPADDDAQLSGSRRMTRGATGVKPRQRIVISSDEEDDTPTARRNIHKLRASVHDSDSE